MEPLLLLILLQETFQGSSVPHAVTAKHLLSVEICSSQWNNGTLTGSRLARVESGSKSKAKGSTLDVNHIHEAGPSHLGVQAPVEAIVVGAQGTKPWSNLFMGSKLAEKGISPYFHSS